MHFSLLPTVILVFTMFYFLCVNATTYNFFRDVKPESYKDARRIFGGSTASLDTFPPSCLLAERTKKPKCSGSIITPRYVVTAAHCIQPYLRYIFYNSRTPKEGESVTIARVYRHPKFSYLSADEGQGPDIVQLYNDIGLVESSDNMLIGFPSPTQKNNDLQMLLRAKDMPLSDVDVLGFGVKDTPGSPELLLVTLHVSSCFRSTWQDCACGEARLGEMSRGVCSGDSGGPVVQEGTLVGVTSMGPSSCASLDDPNVVTTSVFTLVSNYVDMINNTINKKEDAMVELPLVNSLSMSAFSSYITYECAHVSFNIQTWMVTFIVLKIFNKLLY